MGVHGHKFSHMDWKRWIVPLFFLCSVLLVAAPSTVHAHGSTARKTIQAEPVRLAQNAPVAGKVDVELMVVQASNDHNRVDPKLQSILKHLKFTNFKGFTHLSSERHQLAQGQDHTYTVAGGRRVKIILLARDEKRAKLRIQMFNAKNKILDTTVSVHRNKSFMVAGPRHAGGVLLLPVTPRY